VEIIKRDGNLLEALKKQIQIDKANAESARENMIFCLDTSGSMGDYLGRDGSMTKLSAVKKAFKGLVDRCNSGISAIGVVVFGTHGRLVCPLTGNYAMLLIGVSSIRESGNTNMLEGLSICLNKLDRMGLKRVILLSDGQADCDPSELIPEFKSRSIIIDTVSFGCDANDGLLTKLAVETGGTFNKYTDCQSLVNNFKLLEVRIRGLLK